MSEETAFWITFAFVSGARLLSHSSNTCAIFCRDRSSLELHLPRIEILNNEQLFNDPKTKTQ
jgi:hypothetical protein